MKKSTLAIFGIVGLVIVLVMLTLLVSFFAPPTGDGTGQAAAGSTPTAAESTPLPESTPTPATATDGGTTAAATATASDGSTDSESSSGADSTATATATATATPEPTLGDEVDESNISAAILEAVNDRRSARGLASLSDDTKSAEDLTEMAEYHSENMAEISLRAHEYNDNDSADRYHMFDLYSRCQFQSDGGGYVVTADQNQLEVLAEIDVSQYADSGMSTSEIEAQIASDVVDDWYNRYYPEQRLSYENAQYVGIGMEFTTDDKVYVAANLC